MPVLVRVLLALATLVVAACDSGDGDSTQATTYSLGGAVTGLTGSVTIANGGRQVTRTENGAFTLGNVKEGSEYDVTIASQPAGQTCTVYNGSGTAEANVAIILVACTVNPAAAVHTIGGTVSGLSGRLVLQNNLANPLTVTASGAFAFTGKLNDGGHYQVSVATQPFGQTCTVSNGSGTATADVTDITVNCVTARYTVGGTISGVAGGNATLQNNGGDDLVLAGNGTFTFTTTVLHGSPYAVTVSGNPPGLECLVANGSGTAFGNVTNVSVTCALPRYTIGGTITGVSGDVTLKNNGGDELALTGLAAASSTPFTFATTIEEGSNYLVTVSGKPVGYTCTVNNGSGTASDDVTNVSIACALEQFTIGGTISGLSEGTLTLENNGGDSISFSGDGSFGFPATISYGSTYAVTLADSPAALACNVANGEGTATANVGNVQVRCIASAPIAPVASFGLSPRPRELAVQWPAVAGAEYYQLWKRADGSAPWVQVGTDTVATLAGELIEAYRYDWGNPAYYVRACNKFGCSAPSNIVQSAPGTPYGIGYFKASNSYTTASFGAAVALSADGSVMVVGAYGEASDGTDPDSIAKPQSGAAYVFEKDDSGNWTQVALLKSPAPDTTDFFGAAVAISADGDTIAVGAPREDGSATGTLGSDWSDNATRDSGAVFVFSRSGDTWPSTPQAYVKASNTGESDYFGSAVALSANGNTLAVTAPGEDSGASGINYPDETNNLAPDSGAAFVFTRSDTTWTQQAYVKASNTGSGDQFGGLFDLPGALALSADGNTLAIGAPHEDSDATGINGNQSSESSDSFNAGAVYVYSRAGTDWAQAAYVKASNTGSGDQFGATVALSGDGQTLAVGAINEDGSATGISGNQTLEGTTDAGAVYVYSHAADEWSMSAYVKASNTGANDWFGSRIALSQDGSTMVVTAAQEDSAAVGINGNALSNSGVDSGAAYVFDHDGLAWSQNAYVKSLNTGGNDLLGYSIALSADGNTLALGAISEDSAARGINLSGGGSLQDNDMQNTGAVYLY